MVYKLTGAGMAVMRVEKSGLQEDRVLADFLETEALPGTGIGVAAFWTSFADLVREQCCGGGWRGQGAGLSQLAGADEG